MLAIEEKRMTLVQMQTTAPVLSMIFFFPAFFTEFQMSWKRPQFAVKHMPWSKMQ